MTGDLTSSDDGGAGEGRPNPFGYADHTPFAGFGVELVYGRREDGAVVHVSEVPSGRRCNCICPACEKMLVARKGPKKAHHFGHYGKGNGCGRAAETNAHAWAKAVLERELRIMLPEVGAYIGTESHVPYKAKILTFASARLERALDDIVPDVILTTARGDELLVEVRVTHACGPEKIAKLRERALPTVEVNLSAWRTSQDRAAIEKALIKSAEREWLYNRKLDEAGEQLAREIEARAARKAERERIAADKAAVAKAARDQAEARRVAAEVDRLLSEALGADAEAATPDTNFGKHEHHMLVAADDEHLLFGSRRALGFRIPAERWQALIIDDVLHAPFRRHQESASFSVLIMAQLLESCIVPAFLKPIPKDIAAALALRTGNALFPRDAIEAMLERLCMEGYLSRWDDEYEYNEPFANQLTDAHDQWKEEERRRTRATQLIASIVEAASLEEFEGFDLEDWHANPVPPFGLRIEAIIRGNEALWKQCDAALRAIFDMLHGGAVAEHLLGLPLDAAQAQARKRVAAAEAAAARGRETRLRNAAAFDLEEEAAPWLQNCGADGLSPLALASRDDQGLKQALALLEPAADARLKRLAIEKQIQGFRAEIRKAALQALGPALSPFFLNNFDASLGDKPIDHCTDSYTLRACLAVLSGWVARNKSKRAR